MTSHQPHHQDSLQALLHPDGVSLRGAGDSEAVQLARQIQQPPQVLRRVKKTTAKRKNGSTEKKKGKGKGKEKQTRTRSRVPLPGDTRHPAAAASRGLLEPEGRESALPSVFLSSRGRNSLSGCGSAVSRPSLDDGGGAQCGAQAKKNGHVREIGSREFQRLL